MGNLPVSQSAGDRLAPIRIDANRADDYDKRRFLRLDNCRSEPVCT